MAHGRQEVRYHKVQEAESEEPEELTIYLYGSNSSHHVVRAQYREVCLRIFSSFLLLAVAVAFVLYELQYGGLKTASARPPGSLERSWNNSPWADIPPFYQHEEKSTESQHHEESEDQEHMSHDDLNGPEHHSHHNNEESETSQGTHSHNAGTYHKAAVLSDSETCCQISREVLASHGNVVDAGIAAAFCLAVVHTHTTSLGGIFSSLYYNGEEKKVSVLNALPRETSSTKYGIPHLLQGLRMLHQKHGRSSWPLLVDSAVRLSKQGFQVDKVLAAALKEKEQKVVSSVGLCNLFCESDNTVKGEGATVRNPTLGDVLQQVANSMTDATLPSDLIQNLLKDMEEKEKGIFTMELSKVDLSEEDPVTLHFDRMTLHSTPWPSAGKILADSLQETYHDKPELKDIHTPISMHKAYQVLLNASVAAYMKSGTGPRVSPTVILSGPQSTPSPAPVGSTLVVADRNNNVFVMSLSLNSPFGAGFLSPSTGILLSDFACDITSSSPLFWASPSMLLGKEDPDIMILGATGGSSVPFSVAQVIFNHLTLEKDLQESVHGPLVDLSNDSTVLWQEYLGLVKEESENEEHPACAMAIEVEAEHVHVANSPGSCCFSDGL